MIIFKFDTVEHLEAWMSSTDRRALTDEGKAFIIGHMNGDMQVKYGSIVPVDSTAAAAAAPAPTGPPSMLKVVLLLWLNVSLLPEL